MIYLLQGATSITLPKHVSGLLPDSFEVHSPLLTKTIATAITDISTMAMFYIFTIDTTDLSAGEYEYYLKDTDGNTIESGLLTYGDYVRDTIVSTDMPTSNLQFKKR